MTAPELENFRTELIQTAAVIVSAIEDIDYGVAHHDRLVESMLEIGVNRFQVSPTLSEIFAERRRQDEKWGPQHHLMADWLAIIGEEYGEACMAYVDDLLMPTILEQKRIGVNAKPIQWGDPEGTPTTFVVGDTDVDPADELKDVFDRLKGEVDGD